MKFNAGQHSGLQHFVFFIALALLACHELDAVARHEWRLLPILSQLNDVDGLKAFVLLHIPIFAILFWLTGHRSDEIRIRSQIFVSVFFIVHAILHSMLSGHDLYEFEAPIETITVYGAAILALIYLAMGFRQTR